MRIKTPILTVVIGLALTTSSLSQDNQSVIPFQGQLANQAGQPLSPTSPSTLVFRLYRQAVGGIAIWEESQPNISGNAGRFSVLLGSRTELPAAPNFNTTLYLGITVDDGNPTTADVEMRPRQALVPVMSANYAKHADKLAGYDWSPIFGANSPTNPIPASKLAEGSLPGSKLQPLSVGSNQIAMGSIAADRIAPRSLSAAQLASAVITTNELAQAVLDLLVPPGSIMAFGGQTNRIPAGWLLCDGSALDAHAPEYGRLFEAIQQSWGNGGASATGARFPAIPAGPTQTDFNLPDLRGVFLRGVNGARDDGYRDIDANVPNSRLNIFQGGNIGNQIGTFQTDAFESHNHSYQDYWANDTTLGDGTIDQYALGTSDTLYVRISSRTTGLRGGTETRPNNAYVNYIIKY